MKNNLKIRLSPIIILLIFIIVLSLAQLVFLFKIKSFSDKQIQANTPINISNYISYKKDFSVNKQSYSIYSIENEMLNSSLELLPEFMYNNPIIDSMLNKYLPSGIKSKLEYCLYNADKNAIISNSGINDIDLISSSVKNKIIDNENTFYIIFPKKNNLNLNKLITPFIIINIVVIVLSIILIILIKKHKKRVIKLYKRQEETMQDLVHAMKTPITSIKLSTEALTEQNTVVNKELNVNYIDIINEEIKALLILTEQILRFSISPKSIKDDLDTFDLNKLLKEIANIYNIQLKQERKEIILELSKEKLLIEGCKNMISNAMYNLLDNARKYSADNTKITIKTNSINNKFIKINVIDNGIGISKSDQEKIFDRQFRSSTVQASDYRGYGIGLSYVKEVIKAHKGNIELSSEEGKGCDFCIILPRKLN